MFPRNNVYTIDDIIRGNTKDRLPTAYISPKPIAVMNPIIPIISGKYEIFIDLILKPVFILYT
jgi:hypothetical protein